MSEGDPPRLRVTFHLPKNRQTLLGGAQLLAAFGVSGIMGNTMAVVLLTLAAVLGVAGSSSDENSANGPNAKFASDVRSCMTFS